jgi:putative transposase
VNVCPFIEAGKRCRRNVKRACELLKVSRAALCAYLSGSSGRDQDDADLAAEIQAVLEESKGGYGARRVHAGLRRRGRRHGRKRVARLMRQAGPGRPGREAMEGDHHRGPGRRSPGGPDPPGLHCRCQQAQLPLVRRHHLHLHLGRVAVFGHRHRHRLPPRRGIRDDRSPAHRVDLRTTGQRCRRPRPRPRRGLPLRPRLPAQYTSAAFAGLAGDYQVVLSLGRTGQCWDNALAESFFGPLKGELIDLQAWPTRAAARRAVVEYIGWYNGTRLHSTLGYLSPAEYETATGKENLGQVA